MSLSCMEWTFVMGCKVLVLEVFCKQVFGRPSYFLDALFGVVFG